MMKIPSERRPGATLLPKGGDVLLTVQGVSVCQHQAQILISTTEARRLAMRLLQLAEEQERGLAKLRNYQKALHAKFLRSRSVRQEP